MTDPDLSSQGKITDPAQWLDLHGDILFRYAIKYVRDSHIAEDLVQETLLAGLKSQGSFAGQSSEQTWLIGILKNKIMDHFRKSSREMHFDEIQSMSEPSDDNFIESGPEKGTWQPSRRPLEWMVDPNDPAEQKEFWAYLNHCIEELDRKLARVFVLRELEEMDYKEVCNTLAVSHTNLRVMLYRARKMLRKCLEKNWIESAQGKSR